MSTIRLSDVAVNQTTPSLRNRNDPAGEGSLLLEAEVIYTMLGTEAATDIINLVKLPVGAIIVPHLCRLSGNGIAATATVSVGDSDTTVTSAVRYTAAIAATSASLDVGFTAGAAAALTPYTLAGDSTLGGGESWVQATFATLSSPVAGKTLMFRLVYKITT